MSPSKLKNRKPPLADGTLAPVLRQAHRAWVDEARRCLLPTTSTTASFWDRWTAVRYLADRFLGQYRRERALVEELRPFLPPDTLDRLSEEAERVAQVRLELDALGRRRGTAVKVAAASRSLLQLLRRWCSEIERAASRIPRSVLPEEAIRLVEELETFGQLHA